MNKVCVMMGLSLLVCSGCVGQQQKKIHRTSQAKKTVMLPVKKEVKKGITPQVVQPVVPQGVVRMDDWSGASKKAVQLVAPKQHVPRPGRHVKDLS